MKKHLSEFTICLATLTLLFALPGCRRSGVEKTSIEETSYEFHSLGAYSITGGDTEAAGLTGFERDSFHSYFVRAARRILLARRLEESVEFPDIIIRYTLGEKLIVTALDAETRRLVWRGESRDKFSGQSLSREWVSALVEQALQDFPEK